MKALKTFLGAPGESKRTDGLVMAGDEFEVGSDTRARALEMMRPQIAIPAVSMKHAEARKDKVESTRGRGELPVGPTPAEAKAAPGPLGVGSKAGGKTGLVRPQRSSVVVHQPRASRGKRKGAAK